MGITAQVTGLKELQAALFALPPAIGERVLRSSVATGAAVLREEVIRQAPEFGGTVQKGHPPAGTLKKAIYQTRLVNKCTPTLEVFLVSARKGKKFQAIAKGAKGAQQIVNMDAFYWTWVEFGHHVNPGKALTNFRDRMHMYQGTRLMPGASFIMPNPFMRRAYEAKKIEARDAMIAKMRERLSEAIAKARGK
jgi:hypothetical protein